jgi:hypothetical protein
MAVSPFDGANRIRFKGSLGFLIADLRLVWFREVRSKPRPGLNQSHKSQIKITRLSAASVRLPRKLCLRR